MGGLAGLVHFGGPPPEIRDVKAMASELVHRGPDGRGSCLDGSVAFAHRHRAIRPVHHHQPLVSDDLILMMDGWIYQPLNLARLLDRPPDEPDVSLLLEGWRRWGPGVLERVDGAFALAVFDRRKKQLFLVRDRTGVKPLYWTQQGQKFAFASELSALRRAPWVRTELEEAHLAEYLSFQVVHAPRTLLKGIYQVEPAHWLRASESEVSSRQWWRLEYAPPGTKRPPDGEVVERLEESVARAVRRRLPPGVRAGLYLSGGLGSTAIATANQGRLPSYTVTFTDDDFPELPVAGRVAHLLGLEHTQVQVGTAQIAELFDRSVAAVGHPIGSASSVLMLALAQGTRDGVQIALAGDGSEELFGGRGLDDLAAALTRARRMQALPSPLRKRAASLLAPFGRGRSLITPPDQLATALGYGGLHLFDEASRAELLSDPRWVDPTVRDRVLQPMLEDLGTDPLNAVLHVNLMSKVCEASIPRAERTGSAAGLEVRFPLLDREVLEAAAALPGSAKLVRVGGSVHTRWPLRALLTGVLPPALVHRPKRGLPSPLGGWLAGPGRLFLEDRVQKLRANSHGLFQTPAIERLHREVNRSNAAGLRLWSLFVLDSWLRAL